MSKRIFMPKPFPNPGILDIPPYIGGKATIAGAPKDQPVVKLSSNENPHGASPKVQERLKQGWDLLQRYPEGSCLELRQAIAEVHDIPAENIVCGVGSDELITLLCKAYCRTGDEIIYSKHGFLMYKLSALAVGAIPVVADETNMTTDVDAILSCVSDKTKIVFIANPNNPTGTWISRSEVKRLAEDLPKHVILALDSAYCEYIDNPEFTDGRDIVREHDNVIMLRTFSKIYGIAALRLGWMYASGEICDVMNRLRGPFNVSTITQEIGKIAVQDQDYIETCKADNRRLRQRLSDGLTQLGFCVVPSEANFILILFDGAACSADQADTALKENGFIVRRMESYGLDNALRITIGREPDVEKIISIFEGVVT